VLERENRRGREEGDLRAVHHRLEGGTQGHFGLAVPDVAAEQAIHGRRLFHVVLDVGHRTAWSAVSSYGNAPSNSSCQWVSAANECPCTALRAA